MKRFPIMLQLTLIMFCVMAIPISILTWYSGTQILKHSESAIAESTLAGLNANRKLNEMALNSLAQDVVHLAATKVFDRVRNFETLDELNSQYVNIASTQVVLSELTNLRNRQDGVYSAYFYLDGADYVVSSDKGITSLSRYEPMEWLETALEGRRGISGVWFPRKLADGKNVVTYVLPLNRLSTTTKGTIVVNLEEDRISQYLRTSEPGKHSYMLMESDGTIISIADKSLMFTSGTDQPYIKDILDSSNKEGYAYHEMNGEHLIYTWSRSSTQFQWLNVNVYSMDELLSKTHTIQRSIIFITVIIIFAGALLTVLLATWLSKPLRELVREIRARSNMSITKKNELVFLDAAFRRMQEEEEGLTRLLKEREQDTRSLAIHQLLKGEVTKQVDDLFPHPYYMVAIVSIDRYRRYVAHANSETRQYHRYVLVSQCDSLFPEGIHVRTVYQGEGYFVMIINYGAEEAENSHASIHAALPAIREAAAELLGHSVTVGVSSQTDSSALISDRVEEAMEVTKHRMIEGSGGITYWKQDADQSGKYIYPANSERRILNFLDNGDLDSIIKELGIIREEIQSVEYISYDNIMFIYNQILGVTIKHLRENNVSTARIFAGRRNIYSAIATRDTLDELDEYLHEFFGDIIQYLGRSSGDAGYGERITQYLEEHYCEEIVFEDMAKEIGISYSYMRKIVMELTGKSLIDYTNSLRIEKAKQLLLESNLNMTQIAAEIGYANVQSFNRFFRKYEGMPPSSYKTLKTSGAETNASNDQ
ncbi:AraC family transcriptional regulator [Paenibacillus cellulosilyticus]|uniref:AraC family transcriptional regulator n=1 Tax=Paenibacillus cellulosilyticus TaxID=375489 RepID=A0A2V2YXQ6_9BACL|nr:AraC family transcriptional regulator [Paenibacillus cellulosilyticus]PWW05080.1 AraC family transcriptional regulator [Paenibacillus cellulosilyticus]QKS48632.1 AraC family transcriptional regulator [Paenibacillus cellulosilyticus]